MGLSGFFGVGVFCHLCRHGVIMGHWVIRSHYHLLLVAISDHSGTFGCLVLIISTRLSQPPLPEIPLLPSLVGCVLYTGVSG